MAATEMARVQLPKQMAESLEALRDAKGAGAQAGTAERAELVGAFLGAVYQNYSSCNSFLKVTDVYAAYVQFGAVAKNGREKQLGETFLAHVAYGITNKEKQAYARVEGMSAEVDMALDAAHPSTRFAPPAPQGFPTEAANIVAVQRLLAENLTDKEAPCLVASQVKAIFTKLGVTETVAAV